MGLKEELTPEEMVLLDKMEADLFKVGKKERPQRALYHYTTPEGLWGIVRDRAIWATHFRYLNDPTELVHGEEIAFEVAKELLSAPRDLTVRYFLDLFVDNFRTMRFTERGGVYVASFSDDGDQLSQWRAYGGATSAYSIGFTSLPDPKEDNPEAKAGLSLYKCTYDSEEFRAYARDLLLEMAKGFDKYVSTHATREVTARGFAAQALGICWRRLVAEIVRLKAQGFHEENEWRLIVVASPQDGSGLVKFRSGPRGMVPYIPVDLVDPKSAERLPISTIAVGPGDNAVLAMNAAKMFLSFNGYDTDALLRASNIPYRHSR
jgi:hypothetical protein